MHSWADCHLVVQLHADHQSMEEGEETFAVKVDGHDDAAGDVHKGDGDHDGGKGVGDDSVDSDGQ